MKKNVKGFMLAETLVVASFISLTLLFLFTQFRTIVQTFNSISRYNTINALYLTNQIKEYLKENNFQAMSIELENNTDGYIVISDCTSTFFTDPSYCKELMRQTNVNKVIYTSSQNPTVSSSFSKDFVEFINRNINSEENIYYLFAEFQDGTYGRLKINGYYFPTFKEKIMSQNIYTFATSTSDGIYIDDYEDEVRYVYRGTNPNNYILFNDELWRIIALEGQGVKIIGPSIISSVWNSSTNYFTKSDALNTGNYLEISNTNSSLFERLNYDYDLDVTTDLDGGYYNQISSSFKNYISKEVIWNNGSIANTATTLQEIITSEKERTYLSSFENGHLSLINVSDYIKSSTNINCMSNPFASNYCAYQNWLTSMTNSMWTLNSSLEPGKSYLLNSSITESVVTTNSNVLPVLYLKPNLRLHGSGTKLDPYIIIDEK